MHQLIDKKNKIAIYLIFLIILSTTNNKSLEFQNDYSVKIKKFYVSGLSTNNNQQIEDKLNKLLFGNIFFINQESIKKIISQYNLVESYRVKKIYPGEINVEIEPTRLVARISGNNQLFIGSNGKLIENKEVNKTLPFLFGEFNSKKFLEFKKIIENSEFKFYDLKSIFF